MVETPMKLMDCEELQEIRGGLVQELEVFKRVVNLQQRREMYFLCPIKVDKLQLAGNYGSSLFEFVEISLTGCELEVGCLPDDELSKQNFNFLFLGAQPNILGNKKNQVIHYSEDVSTYFHIDPTHRQIANLLFMESTIRLKDNIIDIFEFTEYEVNFAEHSQT